MFEFTRTSQSDALMSADLPFISKQKLARHPLIHKRCKPHQKNIALASCIQSIMIKNAIERVENIKSLGFYSHLFLVPKPHQRWQAFIDFNRLNSFLAIERFKMETPESIRASLIQGESMSSIDLSYTYLHIPIDPSLRKYLWFTHVSQAY